LNPRRLDARVFFRYVLPNSRSRREKALGEKSVILRLVASTLVFMCVMGAIGYVVTRYPELLTSDNLAVVDGVAVSVPGEFNTGTPQTYRCRISKDYVFEPNTTRVATTLQVTHCGFEDSATPN
jgi:hypothetical protein